MLGSGQDPSLSLMFLKSSLIKNIEKNQGSFRLSVASKGFNWGCM